MGKKTNTYLYKTLQTTKDLATQVKNKHNASETLEKNRNKIKQNE